MTVYIWLFLYIQFLKLQATTHICLLWAKAVDEQVMPFWMPAA